LFTISLESSQFTRLWKESFVICLHKKGSNQLSATPGLFQKIITPHLQLLYRSVQSPCQHGFMKRRSTNTNFWELTSFVIKKFKKRLQTVTCTHFSHVLLVRKLYLLGFPVDPLRWILIYLNCRIQKVLFFCVPQGSHQGPLLLLPSVITPTVPRSDLQSDLNYFQTWCSDNLLDLNCFKCKVMTFCRVYHWIE